MKTQGNHYLLGIYSGFAFNSIIYTPKQVFKDCGTREREQERVCPRVRCNIGRVEIGVFKSPFILSQKVRYFNLIKFMV